MPQRMLSISWILWASGLIEIMTPFFVAVDPVLPHEQLRIAAELVIRSRNNWQNIGTTFELNPMRYTVTGAVVYDYIDVNGDYNTANGAIFTSIAPDANGVV